MLNQQFRQWVLTSVTLLAATAGVVAAPSVESDLADRVAQIAVQVGRNDGAQDPDFRLRAALFDAAVQLDPEDGRMNRYRLDTAMRVGDLPAAQQSVAVLRKLEPTNTYFQARQIDIGLAGLETADAKLKYLGDVVAAEALAKEIRSYAAMRAASLYWEQSRPHQAIELLQKAVLLNPLNIQAQRLQWRVLSGTASPLERTNMLLSMLRANPGLPDVAAMLADQLAAVGLYKSANDWYDYSLRLSYRSGSGIPLQVGTSFAATLCLAGRNQEAGQGLQQLLKGDPTDPSAIFLMCALIDPLPQQIKTAAMQGLIQRLQMVRSAAGIANAASRPGFDLTALPSLEGDAAVFSGPYVRLRDSYVASLSDLAWTIIYHQRDPQTARPLIDVLKKLEPVDSALVARLEGWSLLVGGQLPEATVKLSGAADRDALARLGLIDLMKKDPARKAEARLEAKKLLEANPSGVVGVMLRKQLADLDIKPELSQLAEAVRDAVDRYPAQLNRLALNPQEFYAARVTPSVIEHEFGQPILLTVTIRNQSDQPLTLGEGGMIHDIWFDVQLRGGASYFLPGAAAMKLTGPMILQPRSGYTQVVRLDEDLLADLFNAQPSPTLQMNATAVVNAVSTESGTAPGVFGYRSPVPQLLVRSGLPLVSQQQIQQAISTLDSGSPEDRLQVIEAAASYLMVAKSGRGGEATPALLDAWKLLLDKGTRDVSPHVKAWALFRKGAGEGDAEAIKTLMAQPTWYGRMLGALAAASLPRPARLAALEPLEQDQDAIVRHTAAAIKVMPEPATRPTTVPSTQPATGPATQATDGPATSQP